MAVRSWLSAEDLGYWIGRSFAGPDCHIWETMWMDGSAVAVQPPGHR